jgi:shikimate kinase
VKVALIGPRGAGKTTLGPLLADALGVPFFDGDDVLESRSGQTIAELIDDGTFREREWDVTQELLRAPVGVIAFGGGAVMAPEFEPAAADWTLVLLTAESAVLAERIRLSSVARPPLTDAAADEEVAAIWEQRRNHYRALADFSASTDTLDVESVLASLVARLR